MGLREQVVERLETLRLDRANLEATMNAFSGAIEQAEWTLQQMDKESDAREDNADDALGDAEREGAGSG